MLIVVSNQITRSLTEYIAYLCAGTPRCGEATQEHVGLVGIKPPIQAVTITLPSFRSRYMCDYGKFCMLFKFVASCIGLMYTAR